MDLKILKLQIFSKTILTFDNNNNFDNNTKNENINNNYTKNNLLSR